jgi:hypothetical protein
VCTVPVGTQVTGCAHLSSGHTLHPVPALHYPFTHQPNRSFRNKGSTATGSPRHFAQPNPETLYGAADARVLPHSDLVLRSRKYLARSLGETLEAWHARNVVSRPQLSSRASLRRSWFEPSKRECLGGCRKNSDTYSERDGRVEQAGLPRQSVALLPWDLMDPVFSVAPCKPCPTVPIRFEGSNLHRRLARLGTRRIKSSEACFAQLQEKPDAVRLWWWAWWPSGG